MAANYVFTKPAANDPRTAPSHAALHGQEIDDIVDLNSRVAVLEAAVALAGAGAPGGAASVGSTYWDSTNKNFWVRDTTGWVQITQN